MFSTVLCDGKWMHQIPALEINTFHLCLVL